MRFLSSLLLLAFGIFLAPSLAAQEFDCTVRVQAPQLQQADPAVIQTLESSVFEFMNNRNWTDDRFAEEERIECNINITITEDVTPTRFKAEATIQSSRPVLNSTYNTVTFRHLDKEWDFEYAAFEPLNFNDISYSSELTALLGYYAYLMLGYDYDSFAPSGGTPWFVRARQVVQLAGEGGRNGWKAFDGTRNRYWIVDNVLNPRFNDMRSAFYDYHRNGLDQMHKDIAEARTDMIGTLQTVGNVAKANPNTMGVVVFSNTKSDEIFSIFSHEQVPPSSKTAVGNTMVRLDPANAQRFLSMGKSGSGRGSATTSPSNRPNNTVPRGNGRGGNSGMIKGK